MDWRILFPEGFIKHLPRTHSDHCPILLKLHSSHTLCSLLKPFRFEAMWMCHAEFDRIIFGEWNTSEGNVLDKILSLFNKLKLWNKENFGCIFQRKKRLLARLQVFKSTSVSAIGKVWSLLKLGSLLSITVLSTWRRFSGYKSLEIIGLKKEIKI
ncbi:hypothetical protein ACOSQ4_017018 [Xanthoceras sorbifolium]